MQLSAESEAKETSDVEVIVIGIGGATRSGKGTLARKLYKELGGKDVCYSLCQDYFFDRKVIYEELDGNWEDPRALNHDAYLSKINETIEKAKKCVLPETNIKRYVILEGFLLFHDERLVELLDYKFWLEISKKTCHDRRMRTKTVPEIYFQKQLWPCYQMYRKRVFKNKAFAHGLTQMNGTLRTQIILQTALKELGVDYAIEEDKKEPFEQSKQTSHNDAGKCKCVAL
eukprot:136542_1